MPWDLWYHGILHSWRFFVSTVQLFIWAPALNLKGLVEHLQAQRTEPRNPKPDTRRVKGFRVQGLRPTSLTRHVTAFVGGWFAIAASYEGNRWRNHRLSGT